MQKFQNMEHSNSRTFQGLSRTYSVFKDFWGPGIFSQNSRTFKDFSRTLWTLVILHRVHPSVSNFNFTIRHSTWFHTTGSGVCRTNGKSKTTLWEKSNWDKDMLKRGLSINQVYLQPVEVSLAQMQCPADTDQWSWVT